jgi:hypothetical protein
MRAGGLGSFMSEILYLFSIMVLFLVGAAYATVCLRLYCFVSDSYPHPQHRWLHLRFCRGYKVCRILETIEAFSWICFGLSTLMLLWTFIDLLATKSSVGDSAAGGYGGGAPKRSRGYSEAQTYPVARNASEQAPAQAMPQPHTGQPAMQETQTTFTTVSNPNPIAVQRV